MLSGVEHENSFITSGPAFSTVLTLIKGFYILAVFAIIENVKQSLYKLEHAKRTFDC